jgi:hypothetical protein
MNKRYSRKNRLKKLRKSFKMSGAGGTVKGKENAEARKKNMQNKNAQDKNAPKENVKTEKPEGIKPTGNASIKIVFVSDGKGGEQPLVLEFPKLDNDMTRLIRQLSSYIDNTRQDQVELKEQASAIMENMKKKEEEKGEKEGEGPKKNVGREFFKKITNPGSWFTNKDNAPENAQAKGPAKAPENAPENAQAKGPVRRKSVGGKKTRRKTKSSSKTRRNLL